MERQAFSTLTGNFPKCEKNEKGPGRGRVRAERARPRLGRLKVNCGPMAVTLILGMDDMSLAQEQTEDATPTR